MVLDDQEHVEGERAPSEITPRFYPELLTNNYLLIFLDNEILLYSMWKWVW